LSSDYYKKIMKSILIKKYENRRLYDTVNSRYVNLDEVARMLQNGDSVRVVDAVSGEDITRLVLTQIIVEDAKGPDSSVPEEVLRQMVIASGRATQESAVRYMQTMLDIYENSLRVMGTPFSFVQPAGTARTNETKSGAPGEDQNPAAVAANGDDTIDQLKQRVAELESLVSSLLTGKPGKP
jgi:polyhydroxyalkanoate synthesis repressor PhaR